jgi:peptide/nickel transport system substrate-binding protein
MKLRPNNKFAPIAPVNGRTLDMQDVLFSWDRFVRISPSRADLANSVNPAAPVLSFTAPNATTLVIKLKQPSSFMLSLFSGHSSGNLQIFPREADTGYDPKTKLIGSGPYYIADYKPSIGFTLKRNPGFYSNDVGFIDTIEMPIITEYSQALAQLKAGNIYTYQSNYANQVRAEDVVAFKKDVPEIAM